MRAGLLRHRVTLESQTITRDTDGAEVVGWTTTATVWGSVEQLSGSERFVQFGAQDKATASTKITIRYRGSVDPAMRVQALGRTFGILEVRHDPTWRRQIDLLCEEVVTVAHDVETDC